MIIMFHNNYFYNIQSFELQFPEASVFKALQSLRENTVDDPVVSTQVSCRHYHIYLPINKQIHY